MRWDFAIYWVHIFFWASFGVTRMILNRRARGATPTPAEAPVASETHTARFSRVLLWFHAMAFGVMYFGLANAILPNRVPLWFAGQRIAGTLVIAAGAALMCWSLTAFESWRFRAKVDADHRLATGGPFRLLRHPIYMGLNLLALGSAIWVPTTLTWIAFGLMVIGSDFRARAEETVLTEAFGREYSTYCARTRRFIPGIY